MMDDEHIYEIAPDGRKFRATIYEGKYVPLGMAKWVIEVYVPEVEWWYLVEKSYCGWLWDVAQEHCKDRLNWWANNYLDTPVAEQIVT
jgi:hypothetical protein